MRIRVGGTGGAPRFTPTGVGNAWCPRTRGRGLAGSPPRVWGMLRAAGRQHSSGRFTPTGVGNAASAGGGLGRAAVHPHGCGECSVQPSGIVVVRGSPPRVWGMPSPSVGSNARSRFTPTGVGNAQTGSFVAPRRSVHPHGCGECSSCCRAVYSRGGSPPRVWGMPFRGAVFCVVQRFTPTGVGNACGWRQTTARTTVHPHRCGECAWAEVQEYGMFGSPPQVWGMPDGLLPSAPPCRFTPTGVGNARRQEAR